MQVPTPRLRIDCVLAEYAEFDRTYRRSSKALNCSCTVNTIVIDYQPGCEPSKALAHCKNVNGRNIHSSLEECRPQWDQK